MDRAIRHMGSDRQQVYERPLLASKLAIPPAPPSMVHRPRLHEALSAAIRSPVTLLSASPGWGKTALLSSWARDEGVRRAVAWLTLEGADEGDRFWSYLHAALSSATVDGPDAALPVPGAGQDDAYLTELAHALSGLARPLVLILDDVQEIRDPLVLHGLEFLVRHAGERLRLVLSSRADPALPLQRWRVSGELTELRTRDLSFLDAETAQLLALEGHHLDDAQIEALHARAEGWPAGLRLAALALRTCPNSEEFVDQFAGDHGNIADYLHDEVLSGQTPAIRDVLLSTSIVERVCGGLIDALTGRTDGEQVLAGLEHANTFVVALDGGQVWYRYHHLFGDLLLAALNREAPERILHLHHRAASWHASFGQPSAALRHALAAGEWTYATDILVAHWHELAVCGRTDAQRTALPPPREAEVRADPQLALAYAADRLNAGDPRGTHVYLRLAADHRHLLAEVHQERFGLMAAAFRLAEAQLAGDVADVQSLAPQLLTRAGTVADPTHGDDGARAIALSALGIARLSVGDIDAAEEALSSGLAAARRSGLSCPRRACSAHLALLRAVRGQLRLAERAAQAAIAAPPCPGQDQAVHNVHAYVALASVHYQRNELDDAERYLDLATHTGDAEPEPVVFAAILLLRAWLLQAQGDVVHGRQLLFAGREHLDDRAPSSYFDDWLLAAEADLRTAGGHPDGARELLLPLIAARRTSAPLVLALARSHLRDANPRDATRVLRDWDADPAVDRILWLKLDGKLLEVLTAHGLGEARQADRMLEDVLRLAEPEGCRRIFVQGGPPLRELLLDHLDSGTAHWALLTGLIESTEPSLPPDRLVEPLSEPLSSRELTVLRYLQSLLSNAEIAAELSLSVHTVKSHVRNIYRKLAVTRRRDAVLRARALRLL